MEFEDFVGKIELQLYTLKEEIGGEDIMKESIYPHPAQF